MAVAEAPAVALEAVEPRPAVRLVSQRPNLRARVFSERGSGAEASPKNAPGRQGCGFLEAGGAASEGWRGLGAGEGSASVWPSR
jgi:hypothetical protein